MIVKNDVILRQRMKECTQKFLVVHRKLAANEYPDDVRASIKFWLSSVEGLIAATRWIIGEEAYLAMFQVLTPEYVNSVLGPNMPWWDPADAGSDHLPFENEMFPPHKMRSTSDVSALLHRANAIHSKIYRINRFHPGKWHPMYQWRVYRWLGFVENVIRVLDWSLGNRDDASTFYMISDQSLKEVSLAAFQVRPYSLASSQPLRDALPNMDHKPEDFGG